MSDDKNDPLFKCTEHFVGFFVNPGVIFPTTQEESDLMVIAFAIDPTAVFEARPDAEQKKKQDSLRATAKRIRDALIKYGRLNSQ